MSNVTYRRGQVVLATKAVSRPGTDRRRVRVDGAEAPARRAGLERWTTRPTGCWPGRVRSLRPPIWGVVAVRAGSDRTDRRAGWLVGMEAGPASTRRDGARARTRTMPAAGPLPRAPRPWFTITCDREVVPAA